MTMPRLGVRSRLLLAIVGAVSVALAVALVTFSILLNQRLSASATALAKAEAQEELSSLTVRGGMLVALQEPDKLAAASQVWVFSGTRTLEAPRVRADVDRAARGLAHGPERSLDVGEEARLYALPVVQNGVRYGTVVAAVSLAPYRETSGTALLGALLLVVLILGAVTVLSHWMLGRALLPVSRMTENAASWSEHELDRRFDLGEPYDELTRLAATLDSLLERIAATLRHEQRFTAELSHELRTPLARISAEAELTLRRDRAPDEYRSALAAILQNAEHMARTVEALVAAARHEAGLAMETSDAREAVEAIARQLRAIAPGLEVRVTLPDEPVRVAVDTELLQRLLQPLADNAVRYGNERVELALERIGKVASVTVSDDGSGVRDDELALIFEPGRRGSAALASEHGAGLGLALASRLARSAGGEIAAAASTTGGRFTVTLPLAG